MPADTDTDYLHDTRLSLKEKLRRHMEHKRNTPSRFTFDPSPTFLNRWGPWTVLFLICGGVGWGTTVAMPSLYADGWEDWLVPCRIFVAFLVGQVTLNWCLTRWVGSEYCPDIHGTRPADFVNPQIVQDEPEVSRSNGAVSRSGSKAFQGENGSTSSRLTPAQPGSSSDTAHRASSTSKDASGKNVQGGKPARKAKRSYDGYSYTMYVAVALPTEDRHVERKPFPYWSWAPCLMCQRLRPPRCHHCTLCKRCVLKRDHHCFLTGACIGVNNQRFFLVFVFWATLLEVVGVAHMLPYTFIHVFPDYGISWFDFIPPVALMRGVLGYVSLVVPFLCAIFWLLIFFTTVAVGMLITHLKLLYQGATSFEGEHGISVTDTRSLGGKLRAVFGEWWGLNLLVPTYPWFRPLEDAVLWPCIKP